MSADKRRQYAESRIAGAKHSWTAFLKAAEWLTSELKQLAERDPGQARSIAESLLEQTQQFASSLNQQAAERGRG